MQYIFIFPVLSFLQVSMFSGIHKSPSVLHRSSAQMSAMAPGFSVSVYPTKTIHKVLLRPAKNDIFQFVPFLNLTDNYYHWILLLISFLVPVSAKLWLEKSWVKKPCLLAHWRRAFLILIL